MTIEIIDHESLGWIFFPHCPIDSIMVSSQLSINIAIIDCCLDVQLDTIMSSLITINNITNVLMLHNGLSLNQIKKVIETIPQSITC